jgi:hypothetical protein
MVAKSCDCEIKVVANRVCMLFAVNATCDWELKPLPLTVNDTGPVPTLAEVGDIALSSKGTPESQLFTRLVAFTEPRPVAKSHPVLVPKAGWYAELDVESTPTTPDGR